jgi:hypothetical protein
VIGYKYKLFMFIGNNLEDVRILCYKIYAVAQILRYTCHKWIVQVTNK